MIIGLLEVSLRFYSVHSLKEKRSVISPILHKLRKEFNCAAIESDAQDLHEETVLSIVTVNTNGVELDRTMTIMLSAIFRHSNIEPTVLRRETFQ